MLSILILPAVSIWESSHLLSINRCSCPFWRFKLQNLRLIYWHEWTEPQSAGFLHYTDWMEPTIFPKTELKHFMRTCRVFEEVMCRCYLVPSCTLLVQCWCICPVKNKAWGVCSPSVWMLACENVLSVLYISECMCGVVCSWQWEQ